MLTEDELKDMMKHVRKPTYMTQIFDILINCVVGFFFICFIAAIVILFITYPVFFLIPMSWIVGWTVMQVYKESKR